MAQVLLEKLCKTYSGEKGGNPSAAVSNVDLSIEDGEFMVLVGPSGCGKSTTLRLIAGLETPTDGTIRIDGKLMNGVSPKDRDIAMVFQNYALYPHMSVYENMAFGLRMRNLPVREIEARVAEAAAMLGLDDYLGRKPKALSGGQRQRVAVGRAIVRKPKVFLFDEPLSNLDAKMRTSMRAELSRLHARLKSTMIYVTHDQTEAMTMGDRICVMSGGRVQQVADPLSLYQQPANAFVAGFIGSPAMTQIRGTIRSERGAVVFEGPFAGMPSMQLPLPQPLAGRAADHAGRPAVLGIRPEDIYDVNHCPADAFVLPTDLSIEVAEPLGSETFLHLGTEGVVSCVAKVRPLERYEAGQKIAVALDLERAHLFDGASGEALR